MANEIPKGLSEEQSSYLIDAASPNNECITVFEDDGETGYLYLCKHKEDGKFDIVEHLWIYNKINPPIEHCKEVFIIWADNSSRTGLIVDGECWGMFDLFNHRKLNAPRKGNCIISIVRDTWDNGISEKQGDYLKI